MKRFWTSLATFSLVETIGRHPALAAGILTLLGVGGGVGVGNLITPTVVPVSASYFNQNQAIGVTNNGLKLNQGSAGPTTPPSSDPTGSFGIYFETNINSNLAYTTSGSDEAMGGVVMTGNGSPGLPTFAYQRNYLNVAGSQWSNIPGPSAVFTASTSGGSNYNSGFFPATFTGGGCLTEPTGVWFGALLQLTNPGFGCNSAPTLNAASIPNAGGQQTGVTATCAASSVSGQMLVTTSLSVAPGLTPGQTYALSGFTTSPANALNTPTWTAASVTGSGPYTLVGTAAGTCPTISSTGNVLSGTGATFTYPALSTTNPWTGMMGVTAKTGQHICAMLGEYGDNSPFPGSQFLTMVDDQGNALPGAPALVPYSNLGAFNATGYINAGSQSPSSPALNITAMNSYTITGASYNATTGYVTFTTSASTGFVPGSEFTVTGVSPSGYNQTYVAVAGTTAAGTTVVGNPLSGPAGTLQPISNPGAYSSGGGMVSVITPGMQILGEAWGGTGGGVILPYGTFGATGTGGVGTYALASNATFTFTVGSVNTSTPSITVTSAPSSNVLIPGTTFTLNGNTYVITSIGSATGGTGTYTVNTGTGLASGTATGTGAIGSSGSPVTIYGLGFFYFSANPSTNPWLGVLTNRTAAQLGDFIPLIGAGNTILQSGHAGWGGSIGNLAMLYGVVPQQTGGAPSTASLASLCKKTIDIQSFAAVNAMKVNSLYRLNDPGIFGDSGNATVQGYITNSTGTNATLNIVGSPVFGSLALATGTETANLTGVGLPVASPVTIPLTTTAASTYAITPNTTAALGSSGSPVTFSIGAFKPALPIQASTYTGWIDNGGGSTPTLHVTGFVPSGAPYGGLFTGSLGVSFTASIASGTSTLNVTAPGVNTSMQPVIGIGMTVNIPGGTPSTAHIQGFGTGVGWNGTYTLDATVTGASSLETMFGSGILPGPATTLYNVSVSLGSLAAGYTVTDGGVNIVNQPLLITAGSGSTWTVAANYYPSFAGDATMMGTPSGIVPGTYVQNAAITTPVKVIGYQGACGIAGGVNGSLGCYTLSASPNAAGTVGSSGSPATLTGTSIQDGGAIAPGPALTLHDSGPGATYPVTTSSISCSGFGSCTGTAALELSGTYDTSALGGTPSGIQAQVSLSPGGPPIPGCSACAWTNLASYSASLSSGTVFKWSGQAANIPPGGPYYVSARAANGTAYATMQSYIKIGSVHDLYGQGQAGALVQAQSGISWSHFSGLWGLVGRASIYSQNESYLLGPPVSSQFTPASSSSIAGDNFGVNGTAAPFLSEGVGTFEQLLSNAFGWPVSFIDITHDGVGIILQTLGNVTQTQTIGVGNGTNTTFCSVAKFCNTIGQVGPLTYSAASLTGAQFNGSVATTGGVSTLTVGSPMISGALEPGMALSGLGVTGSPTLVNCTSNCGSATAIAGAASTWTLSSNQGSISSQAMRADYPQTGGTPWPTFNVQTGGTLPFNTLGYGSELIKAGTFQVSVNGTVVCKDTQAFAYNNTGGNCADTGGGIVSSTGTFVNYQTGDYQITFNSAPASNAAIVASWTNIISPENVASAQFSRPAGVDFFGDGTPQSGFISTQFSKTPSGSSGHINSGCSTDEGYILQNNGPTNRGYQFGAPGYSTMISWLYGTKMPALIPGMNAGAPYIASLQYRNEGPTFFNNTNNSGKLNICDQWGQDISTKSTFSGSIAGGVLTLSANAVGPMWEGEVIGGAGLTSPTGIFITSLAGGAWGQSGSTYNLSGASGVTATGAMYNDVFYKGSGPAIYGGALYDIAVQNQGLSGSGSGSGTTGVNPHMFLGFDGGRRVGARLAATIWGGESGNPANASPPALSRVNDSAAGTPSPAFDYGNTYAASATGTVATVGGVSVVTFSSGLSAHARPFVDGQWVTCSGCTPQVITSVSAPPTQSTVSGQGEVSQSFSITLSGSLGVTGSAAINAGCHSVSGSGGSNCINIDFSINTTNGTFGTAAALATCGANNLNGNAPNYSPPAGKCQDNGIGELTRGFRIGTAQAMYISPFPTGSVFDDGADFEGGAFNQSAAFTCNIVAAKTVQCVLNAAYASGVFSSVGKWASGSTFVNYGDMSLITGRIASVIGYVGGQSSPIANAGSGYANGFYTSVAASCPTLASGGYNPKFDITVSGGSIVNVIPSSVNGGAGAQPMGLGVGSACTLTNTNFPSGMINTSGSGGSINIPLAPAEGTGGVMTYNTDTNELGLFLYDNTGFVGNPLNPFFSNGMGGYFEPGLPVRPFGEFQGAAVSG